MPVLVLVLEAWRDSPCSAARTAAAGVDAAGAAVVVVDFD